MEAPESALTRQVTGQRGGGPRACSYRPRIREAATCMLPVHRVTAIACPPAVLAEGRMVLGPCSGRLLRQRPPRLLLLDLRMPLMQPGQRPITRAPAWARVGGGVGQRDQTFGVGL